MIAEETLYEFGAVVKRLRKGETLFSEGETAVFYYQVAEGVMKMNNFNDAGDENIQGLFRAGESFGEPAILGDFPFPANGMAADDSRVIALEKHAFFDLLRAHPDVSLALLGVLSNRLRFKAVMAKEMKGFAAQHQIMSLLEFLKEEAGGKEDFRVNITRQTIANLTGLRVETVIRAIKRLAADGKIRIENRKLVL